MPNKKKKSKNQMAKMRQPIIFQQPREIPEAVIKYDGPIVYPSEVEQADTHTQVLHYTEFLSSDGAGTIAKVYSTNPSSASEWSILSGAYDEYRVLGLAVKFYPNNRYSKTTTICRPLVTLVDRADSTAMSSYGGAVSFSSSKILSLEDPWTREIKMASTEEAQFLKTTTPAPTMYIKLYADSLTASTSYGMVILYYRIQFRGKD